MGNDVQRDGLDRVLRSLPQVGGVRSYADLAEALPVAVEHGADLLVLVLSELEPAGRERLRALEKGGPSILVLLDEEQTADLDLIAAVPAGAGFVSTADLGAATLSDALDRMAGGELPMPARMVRSLLAVARESLETTRTLPRMTQREQEALVLLVQGLSNKQIGRRLGISDHGAKRLVANIMAKLNCPNRTLAVARALREGLYEECLRIPDSTGPVPRQRDARMAASAW